MEINWTKYSQINNIPVSSYDTAENSFDDNETVEIVFDCLKHETDPTIRKALIKEMFEKKTGKLENILKSVWQT